MLPQALAVGDDPTAADGTIRIRSTQGAGFDWTHALDRSKWRFVSREGWRYGDDGTIQRLTVGPDRHIKLVTRAIADVVLESDPHPVDVTITVGRDRYCLRFGGEMTFRRLKKFRAKDAPAPQTCTP
jgi:hypothetical protein